VEEHLLRTPIKCQHCTQKGTERRRRGGGPEASCSWLLGVRGAGKMPELPEELRELGKIQQLKMQHLALTNYLFPAIPAGANNSALSGKQTTDRTKV